MMSRGNNCHNIGSLRELRSLQHANEVAKEAAAGRVKSGVAGAFSLSCLFVTLVRHYAPGKNREQSHASGHMQAVENERSKVRTLRVSFQEIARICVALGGFDLACCWLTGEI